MSNISCELPKKVLENYFDALVHKFFKILPIRESEEPSLNEYICSLQLELTGCKSLFVDTNYDDLLVSLISILQYLSEHDCEVYVVKREVFKAISICKKLKKKYCEEE